ncbi:MAG: LysR family transcriptional regulator [Eubacteriales bacterium]|nr:LysR family transcriptional regulator [Eubacteriales bacterium]
MTISFDSYRVFYYVAHYQNITLAARTMFLTQPTVSHYILNLEKELNCKLFIRSKKGMQLTPEGELLYRHISKAYAEIFRGEEELKDYLSMGGGLIKIGASETTLRNYLTPILGRFKEKYPNIQLRITNTTYQLAETALKSGTMDLAVMTTPFPDTSLSVQTLADFSMAVIAGPSYSKLTDHPLTFKEVARHSLICLEPGTSGRYYLDMLFASNSVHLHPDIELSSADLITPMAIQNMGIGFVPRIFAEHALQDKKVVELTLTEALPTRSICVLKDPDFHLSLACQRFLEELG